MEKSCRHFPEFQAQEEALLQRSGLQPKGGPHIFAKRLLSKKSRRFSVIFTFVDFTSASHRVQFLRMIAAAPNPVRFSVLAFRSIYSSRVISGRKWTS